MYGSSRIDRLEILTKQQAERIERLENKVLDLRIQMEEAVKYAGTCAGEHQKRILALESKLENHRHEYGGGATYSTDTVVASSTTRGPIFDLPVEKAIEGVSPGDNSGEKGEL